MSLAKLGIEPEEDELLTGYEDDEPYIANPYFDEGWDDEWSEDDDDEEFPPFELVFGDGVYLPSYTGGVMHLLPVRLLEAETVTWEQVLPWERWREHCYDELADPAAYAAYLIGWGSLRSGPYAELDSPDDYYLED